MLVPFRRISTTISARIKSLGGRQSHQMKVHFLHIGKNAGTQIGYILDQVNEAQTRVRFEKRPHGIDLNSLPQEEAFFFSVRDPAARFRSGFYSRKRMGRPRHNKPWSSHEVRLFNEFEHANDLAECLFDDGPRGRSAFFGMLSAGHLGRGQVDWFKGSGYFLDLRPPVWIVRQEQLQADMEILFRRLGMNTNFSMSADPVTAHVNDYSEAPDLSEKALHNLKRWHAPDYAFCLQIENWLSAQV